MSAPEPEPPRGFWSASTAEPEREVLMDPHGRTWSAGEIGDRANQIVHGLRARGLEPGARVATFLPNGEPLISTVLAVFQAGWQYAPINLGLTAGEIAYILTDSQTSAFVADATLGDQVHEAAEMAKVPVLSVDGLADGQPASPPSDRVSGQFMQYTSGTTGRPKAVVRDLPSMSPEQWVAAFAANMTRYGIQPRNSGGDHVHLVTSPMYHMAPLSYAYFSLHFEHPVVLMERWDAEHALQLIDEHRVTTTHMVPTQLHRLMLLPEDVRAQYDVSSLSHLLHAAAPCPAPLKKRLFEWLGPVIYEFYGATEGGGTMATPDEWLAHPGTVGRPWPGADVKIIDDDGDECGPGVIGTVYMKLMGEFAYKGDPGKTATSRLGGYFTVGDVGELDEEGYLYLRDRKIDMIISGGVNVYPAEIEAVLLDHPAVGDVAVFGVPHDDWGEEVKAVVEPAPGRQGDDLLALDLLAHCATRLARYKRPRSIEFTAALPRDPNGKLYKRKLRDPYWEGRDRQI